MQEACILFLKIAFHDRRNHPRINSSNLVESNRTRKDVTSHNTAHGYHLEIHMTSCSIYTIWVKMLQSSLTYHKFLMALQAPIKLVAIKTIHEIYSRVPLFQAR
jgi:hypothetical protein